MDYDPKKFCDRICEGVPISRGFSEEDFRAAMEYKPRKGELFIVTYPRSGTTWMHYIVLLILRRGKLSDDPMDFHLGCPFLEMTGSEAADYMENAGVARSHFPYNKMPTSQEAKYIFVCRNPKDCAVSNYNATKEIPTNNFENGTFDEFFEYFIRGDLAYGDYFDHLIGWYEHRNDPNVYLVTYENLKKDTRGEILKLAKFIGEEHENVLLNDPNIMEDILRYSSFEYMRKHTNEIISKFMKGEVVPTTSKGRALPPGLRRVQEPIKESKSSSEPPELKFVRKGIVGDWMNYFKLDQLRRLQERIAEKTSRSDVMDLWK